MGRQSVRLGSKPHAENGKENTTNVAPLNTNALRKPEAQPTTARQQQPDSARGGQQSSRAIERARAGAADHVKVQPDAAPLHVLLEEWSFAFNGSRPLQLTGRVFSNAGGFEDGDVLEYTSQVVEVTGRIAMTKSGTTYYLGRPAGGLEQLRKQLWLCSRSGALGRDDGSSVPPLDPGNPLDGIKLGDVVPCAPVRLPKVPGWSHQSGVALLHNWSTERTCAGFVAVVGTVYNCPGSYDGAEGYKTSTVVDCRGRMLRTLEGAEYFLGRRVGADAEEKAAMIGTALLESEAAALGLLEDLLAV